jgi:hypothetical protein
VTAAAYPVRPVALASAGRSLAAEFPGWEVAVSPAGLGMWTAYWQSDDGRHRWCIVASSAPQLLDALRARGARNTPPATTAH